MVNSNKHPHKRQRKNSNGETSCQNKKLFLEKYPEYGSVGATLKTIGVNRRATFYDWCNADPKFKAFYETELLPNRRDEVASMVYRAATGRLKKSELSVAQLTAAFGFLKATDHNDKPDTPDRLIFIEKNQVQISGDKEHPLNLNATFRFVMPDGTEKTAQEMVHGD